MMEASCSRFTPAEGGARLAAAASEKNVLAVEHPAFIATRLVYEHAHKIRGSLHAGRQRSVHVTRASRVALVAYDYRSLTDLAVASALNYSDVCDWSKEVDCKEVIVCTSAVLKQLLEEEVIYINNLNVLILESCHLVYRDENLKYILKLYKDCEELKRPRILALTYPLFLSTRKEGDTQAIDKTNDELEQNTLNEEIDKDTDVETPHEIKITEIATDDTDISNETKNISHSVDSKITEIIDIDDTENKSNITDNISKSQDGNDETKSPIDNKHRNKEVIDKDNLKSKRIINVDSVTDNTEGIDEQRTVKSIDCKVEKDSPSTETTDTIDNEPESKNVIDNLGVYENLDDFDMYEKLEWKIEELEKEVCCQMDLAEDIDGGKRLSAILTKPKELIIEYNARPATEDLPEIYIDLETYMKDTVFQAMQFLDDHRFDPMEIYGEDYIDELQDVPDPKIVPKYFLRQFLYVLEQLGPYAADKVAFSLLMKLEKLRVKEKYDRHFLLLCLITTVFIKIRCYTDSILSPYTDWDKIRIFSTPKLLRFIEILEKFQPTEEKKEDISKKDTTNRMLNELNKCDFISLSNKIEDQMNTIECNLKEIVIDKEDIEKTSDSQFRNEHDISGNKVDISGNTRDSDSVSGNKSDISGNKSDSVVNSGDKSGLWFPKRQGGRSRGRGRVPRNNAARVQQMQQNPDALCGIVFMKEALMARTMFLLMVDLSRCNPKLSYLCVQYCAVDNPADPCADDTKKQGKKHEDVLKKFRMHECNLLLATSALEEGIDLPRCNLVLRWDVPASYRSYGLCRGRARAPRSSSALLCRAGDLASALLDNVATYRELDQIITRKCGCGIQDEPAQTEEDIADSFTCLVKPYAPQEKPNAEIIDTSNNDESDDTQKNLDVTSINDDVNCTKEVEIKKSSDYDIDFNIMTNDSDDTHKKQDVPCSKDGLDCIKEIENKKSSVDYINKIEVTNDSDDTNRNQAITCVKDDVNCTKDVKIKKSSDDDVDFNQMTNDFDTVNATFGNETTNNSKEINIENNKNKSHDLKHLVDNDKLKSNNLSEIDNLSEVKERNVNEQLQMDTIENVILSETDDSNDINVNNDEEKDNTDKVDKFNEKINSEIREIDEIGNEMKSLGDEISKMTMNSSLINDVSEDDNRNEIDKLTKSNGIISYNELKCQNTIFDGNNRVITTTNDSNVNTNNIDSKMNCDINDKKLIEDIPSRISRNQEIGRNNCDIGDSDGRNKIDSKKIVDSDIPNVDLSTAIPLINRYCAKLPSDTFTRLAPQWWIEEVRIPLRGSTELCTAYICTLKLPLNCPVKYNIVGHPMRTRVLARRMAALQACRILHKSGELDDQLMPIGKENFKAAELESNNFGDSGDPNDAARPGTTKRRQYYYKRTAWAFTDCQPVVDSTDADIASADATSADTDTTTAARDTRKGTKRNMLYAIVSKLSCALPERYNTRGRRLHAPQHANQAIGILMARDEPDNLQIPAFPVYTRSGEVRVSVEYVPDADVRISPRRAKLVRRFMRFVFAEVLRVHRRGMKLQSEGSTHNNYYVVPTTKSTREDGSTKIDIDWSFLELIYQHTEDKKQSEIEKPIIWEEGEGECKKEIGDKVKEMENPLLKPGEVFEFDAEKYKEAVVTPWYRNQDQPQFFLVAEICWNLTPDSAFPSASHSSFRHYYNNKYGVVLTQPDQPLLDVDHTSARLNLLTPRYVNRKGVALPVSSERTRRAKRDRLDQKQILVPELCKVHPFAAPLWFSTVALPCVLYRINALLIADEIRRAVAIDVGLGIPKIDETNCPGFQWPPLDFGWSLAEVLNADSEKCDKRKDEDDINEDIDNKTTEEELKGVEEDGQGEKEKTVNDILQEKENAENSFEIGTWSNDMAYNIPPETEYDEFMEPLPSNVTLVTSESGGVNWSEKPRSHYNPPRAFSMADSDCSYMSSDFDTDTDSDYSYEDSSGFGSGKVTAPSSFRIEYKTAHEAEAFDVERKKVNPAPQPDPNDDELDKMEHDMFIRSGEAPKEHIEKFRKSVAEHKKQIIENGHLIDKDQPVRDILPEITRDNQKQNINTIEQHYKSQLANELFPYKADCLEALENGQISLESIEKNKRLLLSELKKSLSMGEIKKLKCFSMVDVNIDDDNYVNEKVINVGFDTKEMYEKKISSWDSTSDFKPYFDEGRVQSGKEFDFDYQPELKGHPGPSPSVILQALTMSNANDGINLERLETIGDSFLKFAITAYLYCAHPTVHEGKLSHMRSKQVSNLNLYRLGRNKRLGARMIASKFEPHDNWLPPCHKPPPTLHPKAANGGQDQQPITSETPVDSSGCFIPYNLITQHSIPDKSIADCVEALIGAYLLECGPRGALLFMAWLGIAVLPAHRLALPALPAPSPPAAPPKPEPKPTPKRISSETSDSDDDDDDYDDETDHYQQEMVLEDWSWPSRPVGSLRPYKEGGKWFQTIFGELKAPPSPLLRYIEDPEGELEQMLSGYDALERTLQYRFKDRSLLLQALTHASHQTNRLTDCYQRLEFLGDAILDYLITRHLYEEPRRHSPGALTDLRSALVNNTIFAILAARHGFHKYFRHMSPGLNEVLTKYVKIQEENGHSISEEHYLIQEDEMEQAEDVEVPKALGDLFESVAGAIFLDSGMSLGAVWKSYVNLMGAELEAFSAAAPKSPVRELLEAEPDTAKFGKPERLADGRRVRVSVEVFGRGTFKGIGRNYRIAKGTAARCALRHLRLLHKGH